MSLERHFDPVFTSALALREKQIQQSYRPIIGIHKWFARRPGTVFRNLILSEFNGPEALETSYWRAHALRGVIADPFMGGGTPIFEANRLGFDVVGTDINPMAYWVVRQSLVPLDLAAFLAAADEVATDIEEQIGALYQTTCLKCKSTVPVKYFLWVKTETCPNCDAENDLFPGYLLAEAERHPRHVVVCAACGALNEYDRQPDRAKPGRCGKCGGPVHVEGALKHQEVDCRECGSRFKYPLTRTKPRPPKHRMWAIEYHCPDCKPDHAGRFFKQPDKADLARVRKAQALLARSRNLPIPKDEIPEGDETARLHRWGYRHYREMFNERQLLGLGLLLRRIRNTAKMDVRHALLTVFSDFLRYQNLLCRYDTYALKCQDIFSVHGFPVGLVQCENNLLGIPRVGSGSFRHFVEKYRRSKEYCEAPFETAIKRNRKTVVSVVGERIAARLGSSFPKGTGGNAWLRASTATDMYLPPASLDGVFTDPPYFANVQYAELMDFCFAWLRLGLKDEFADFERITTRASGELTGNVTLGRGVEHFTDGLSAVFRHYGAALKPGAPLVFTYHHNDPVLYSPIVVAILDAGMECTATLPVAAEMTASLHIAGTSSSVLDSVFVCRREPSERMDGDIEGALIRDADAMTQAGVRLSEGDLRCLLAGHFARVAINGLHPGWDAQLPLGERLARARAMLAAVSSKFPAAPLIEKLLRLEPKRKQQELPFATTV